MLRLSVLDPDHRKIVVALLEHQGKINLSLENFPGALKAFGRMRDVAEDCGDRETEMRSYLLLGKTLQAQSENKQAVVVLKRLLQIAWCEDNFQYEMKAYEMIGKQYFYL